MSRFADPTAKDRFVLGPCECPGTPHAEDWMELRTELGAEDALRIGSGTSIDAIQVLVLGWNLLDKDGELAPVDRAHLASLFGSAFEHLDAWIEEHVRFGSLPNGSAARSRATSGASGSRRARTAKMRA